MSVVQLSVARIGKRGVASTTLRSLSRAAFLSPVAELRAKRLRGPQADSHHPFRRHFGSSILPASSRAPLSAQHQAQNHPRRHGRNLPPGPTPRHNAIASPLSAAVSKRWHGGPHVDHDHADSVHVSFVDGDGKAVKADVDAYVGESLLQVAQRNDIELEGACEGVCACSTCHVVIPDWETFDMLEEASEDEEDMLDMAYGLTETSRLSCQIIVTDDMDGMEIEIPRATRNFYVDGHVPKPH